MMLLRRMVRGVKNIFTLPDDDPLVVWTKKHGARNLRWIGYLMLGLAGYHASNLMIHGYWEQKVVPFRLHEAERLRSRNVLITGGNGALGKASVKGVTLMKGKAVFTVRDRDKGDKVIRDLGGFKGRMQYIIMDLSDLRSVYAAMQEIKRRGLQISHIVCAAGIMDETIEGMEFDNPLFYSNELNWARKEMNQMKDQKREQFERVSDSGMLDLVSGWEAGEKSVNDILEDDQPHLAHIEDVPQREDFQLSERFVVNYLSHWYICRLWLNELLEQAREGKRTCIIQVSDDVHYNADVDFDEFESIATGECTYDQSKLLQLLHMKELQRIVDDALQPDLNAELRRKLDGIESSEDNSDAISDADNSEDPPTRSHEFFCTAMTPGYMESNLRRQRRALYSFFRRWMWVITDKMFSNVPDHAGQSVLIPLLCDWAEGGTYYFNGKPHPMKYQNERISDEEWAQMSKRNWDETEKLVRRLGLPLELVEPNTEEESTQLATVSRLGRWSASVPKVRREPREPQRPWFEPRTSPFPF